MKRHINRALQRLAAAEDMRKPTSWITTEGEGVWECQGCQTQITATEDEGFLMGECPACGRPIEVYIVYKD